MWRFWAPPHTPSLNILLAFFLGGGGRRVKYCLNKVHGVLFYQMFLFFNFFYLYLCFGITFFSDVGPHNLIPRCWDFNRIRISLGSYSSISLLYFEGPHNESCTLSIVMELCFASMMNHRLK